MGNSGSGHGGGALGDDRPSSPPPGRIRPKVLPDLAPAPRLRLTDNGLILHNGGTISIKKPEKQKTVPEKPHIDFRRDFYGSEPDLRFTGRTANFTESPSKLRISRSKKKYKAPQVPNNFHGDSSSPDSYQEWENSNLDVQPSRRLRLFKTRAETRKKLAEHNLHSLNSSYFPPAGALQRSLSTPQFHAELLEAAEKLRPVREPPVGKASESPSPPPSRGYDLSTERDKYFEGTPFTKNCEPQHKYHNANIKSRPEQRPKVEGCSNGRDSPYGLQEPWRGSGTKSPQPPVKSFYFGMDLREDSTNEPSMVDRFIAKIQQVPQGSYDGSHSANSDAYSDSVVDDDIKAKGAISVQLRATLPRKQLDIPRFSPTTAWRLLSAIESPQHCEEDDLVQCEQRIFAPPLPIQIPALMDKSADSGISGDASPQHQDSTPNSQAAWTPQQDLEETSSDGGFPGAAVPQDSCSTAKYSPRFTLSLPRDDRVKLYSFDDKQDEETEQPSSLHSLKKLKRSMSGALGKVVPTSKEGSSLEESSPLLDSNWVLSRSVPNSLNMTHVSLTRWNTNEEDGALDEDEDQMSSSLIKQPSFSYLQTGGHVMYLPEYSKPSENHNATTTTLSKSCEDLSSRAVIDDNPPNSLDLVPLPQKTKKIKKFTFQSTVRQIERKRLAAQLSKQAEHKEKERKSELEAMRKVEEEFQKKREREKADIRQQLRLYSITHNNSKPPSPEILHSTQVLSEFRQQQREYKDYRPHRRTTEAESSPKSDPKSKKATVHPQVICQIPKSSQMYITPKLGGDLSGGFESNEPVIVATSSSCDNYRKNFAQGALPHSLAGSDSEVSQANSGTPAKNRNSFPKGEGTDSDFGKDRINELNNVEHPKITIGVTELKTVFMPHPVCQQHEVGIDKTDSTLTSEKKKSVPLKSVPCMGVNSLQPFMRGKTYRPISFTPGRNHVAQFAS
ncbi:Hypothetical protein NTJ_03323 [Nesidiocoris tenuis]|uniref:CCDC66 domain-containing protein n=1 Tax=Nesidiocoris tenuis TaxID=355587 RepID=A0ABN7AE01_9HEMI|nr:Hypothetical protein NTJ_03323 [Nesidiocoris tenuis]